MSVSATDADDPMTENAFLSYSIIGQESIPASAINKVMFGINNETGAIYTRDVGLDREVKCSLRLRNKLSQIITSVHSANMSCILCQVVKGFRLRLQIADMGGMGLTSEGVATIHISDINNHAPQFSPASVSLSHSTVTCCFISVTILSHCCSSLSLSLFLVYAVHYDSSGKQEGLRDRPCECDRPRRPRNRKLGSQILHFQRPQRQLCHQYGSYHQPGRPDCGGGTVCSSAFRHSTKRGILLTLQYRPSVVSRFLECQHFPCFFCLFLIHFS